MSKISHIGIVVKDLNKSVEIYSEMLGCSPDIIEEVPNQKVKVAIFRPGGPDTTAIELICPVSDDSPVSAYMKKRGEGMHHISLSVSGLAGKLDNLKKKNFRLIDEVPRDGAEGKKIAFVHPSAASGVLIELEEE